MENSVYYQSMLGTDVSVNSSENNLLEKLLSVPLKNLEERIKQLEEEIGKRTQIRVMILSELEHQRKSLEGKLNELDFDKFNSAFVSRRTSLEATMLNVEQGKLREEVACFRDIVILREKLRFAEEELRKEKVRSDMVLNGRNKTLAEKIETGFG